MPKRYKVEFIVLTDAPIDAVRFNFEQMQGENTSHEIIAGEDVWEAQVQDTKVQEAP